MVTDIAERDGISRHDRARAHRDVLAGSGAREELGQSLLIAYGCYDPALLVGRPQHTSAAKRTPS